jgi:hypothetical protein
MFRFTIRELLLLTAVVGLAVGWWLDRSRLRQEADTWYSREEIIRDRIKDFGIQYTWPGGEWSP